MMWIVDTISKHQPYDTPLQGTTENSILVSELIVFHGKISIINQLINQLINAKSKRNIQLKTESNMANHTN